MSPNNINTICYNYFNIDFVQLMSELDGKDINEVIADGMGKLASMPSGT